MSIIDPRLKELDSEVWSDMERVLSVPTGKELPVAYQDYLLTKQERDDYAKALALQNDTPTLQA
ncbi:MAG: hypothetical protein LBN07_03495 [Christensenellaceae bacterium]|jgi:hypothetical protein|nr:hypothetical protein [Christensenellaceae bacterium]